MMFVGSYIFFYGNDVDDNASHRLTLLETI